LLPQRHLCPRIITPEAPSNRSAECLCSFTAPGGA
jgi:hypothetical protein